MKPFTTFLVGGGVRDKVLGIKPQDLDFVMVDTSREQMLAAGYEEVGKGFPVFLHPVTREEYALTRREIKVGHGHCGFECETDGVTLEEDLSRRDLTMNSMAFDGELIIDPHGGLEDIRKRVLRHTSTAFIEDPLRVVRLARFYARYFEYGFTIAVETEALARYMVWCGDLDKLPNERFEAEIKKALAAPYPGIFFEMLHQLGVLTITQYFKNAFGSGMNTQVLRRITQYADDVQRIEDEDLRFQVFVAASYLQDSDMFPCTMSSRASALISHAVFTEARPSARSVLNLLTEAGAFRQGGLFNLFIETARTYDSLYKNLYSAPHELSTDSLLEMAAIARTVTSEPFRHLPGSAISEAMYAARLEKIETFLSTLKVKNA